MPCNKMTFANKDDARKQINMITATGCKAHGSVKGSIYPYQCPNCTKWHLTSSKKLGRKETARRIKQRNKEMAL